MYGSALLMAYLYRFTIQQRDDRAILNLAQEKGAQDEAAGRANQTQDEAAGMTIIKENYKRYTSWGPTAKVARMFGKLPATPDFESRKNIVKPKALVSANEEKRKLDDTVDEEDGGLIGRRQRAGNDC